MRAIGLTLFTILASVGPATAVDVLFNGTVLSSCSILGHTNGSLGVDLGTDGQVLTSDLPYGAPGTVTLLSVGTNYVNVAAPTRTNQPAEYVPTGESLEVSYLGVGALSAVNQGWTTSSTSAPATALIATALTINNRITNSANGFPAGTYQTQTVVTCTPTAQF